MGRAVGPRASELKSGTPSVGGSAGSANSATWGASGPGRELASCGAP